jgi:predicted Zn-dependent peptidase
MPKRSGASFAIERFTLDNGLRVVVSPDTSSPTVMVAVSYDVGFRSEPEGRTGFAHLFEHFMFEGSDNLPKGELDRIIESNGGALNGFTRLDQTVYWEVLPSSALEVALFAEADRMHGLALTEESLQNQIDVVKEEIRVNVHNRPYGGFPWIDLPAVMFETFPNAHDGYGSFEDLESATLEDAFGFFEQFYAPGNAVLAVVGDAKPEDVRTLADRHFCRVPRRGVPKRPDFDEPEPSSERRSRHEDPNAPRPALALGYRVPDPIDDLPGLAAAMVTAAVLGDGDASRLYQRLVKDDQIATHLSATVGEFGDALGTRHPTMLEIVVYYVDRRATDAVTAAVDEEIAKVADGVDPGELARVVSSMTADYLWGVDQIIGRATDIVTLEQLRGRPELLNDIPDVLRAVTPSAVAGIAQRWLDPRRRAVLEWVPGARS